MNSEKVEINFDKLKELGISPNQYTIAYCIHNNLKTQYNYLIDCYKDECVKEDIFSLIEKGYLSNKNKENIFEISFENCSIIGIFDGQKIESAHLSDGEFITQFLDKFPSGVTSGGIYVKSSKRDVETKFKKFEKKYPEYDRNTILKATENYIERSKINNYKFMKVAHYFILKNDESVLASECEAIINGEESPSSSIFIDRV